MYVCVILQRGQVVAELLEESWDEDPEARLTAANILHRLKLLQDIKVIPQDSPIAASGEEDERLEDSTPDKKHHSHRKLCSSSSFSGQPVVRTARHPAVRYSIDNEMMSQLSRLESFSDQACCQHQSGLLQLPNNSRVDSATGQPCPSLGESSIGTCSSLTLTHSHSVGSMQQQLQEVGHAEALGLACVPSQSSPSLA